MEWSRETSTRMKRRGNETNGLIITYPSFSFFASMKKMNGAVENDDGELWRK